MRVIVTRPQQDAGPWVTALADAGHDAVSLPLLGVGPAPDPAAVVAAWERMAAFDAVMFVSGNAIAQFFALKPAVTAVFTAQTAIKTRAFVVGPGSVAALLRAGAQPAYIDAPAPQAGQFDSEALWAVVGHRVRPGYRVLIVRGADSAG
ncbi:MAG: uroporphyrinogen-III synthase, partial [Rhodoferax sp.]